MKLRIVILLFLVPFVASAAPDMKDCVAFMRGDNSVGPYFPVNDRGELDRVAVNKLVADKKLTYGITPEGEIVNSNWGGTEVSVRVDRKSGKVTQITSTFKAADGKSRYWFPVGSQWSSMEGKDRQVGKTVTNFRYQGDRCVPESNRLQFLSEAGKANLEKGVISWQIDTCRNLHQFFKDNPGALACGDNHVEERLKKLIGASEWLAPVDKDWKLSGDLYFFGRQTHERCASLPGVADAVRDEKLWSKPGAAQEGTAAPTTGQ